MINITNEDNMLLMARYPDNHFDLAIVDPPYGINADEVQNKKEGNNGYKTYKKTEWDSKIHDLKYFDELKRVSKNQIIWGANYMTMFLPASMGWIMWDKGQRNFSHSDGELAYSSFDRALRIFTMPRGTALSDANRTGGKIHPTQKPVKLYEWLLKNYAKQGDKILDTHGGSLSIALAVHNVNHIDKMDLTLDVCELDTDYYNDGVTRYKNHIKQLTIF